MQDKHHRLPKEVVILPYLSFSVLLLLNLCGRRPDMFLNRNEAILMGFVPSRLASTSLGMFISAAFSSIGVMDSAISSSRT
jgi:hypothetical protein